MVVMTGLSFTDCVKRFPKFGEWSGYCQNLDVCFLDTRTQHD